MAAIRKQAVSFGDDFEAATADPASDSLLLVGGSNPLLGRTPTATTSRRPNVPGGPLPPKPLTGAGVGAATTSYRPTPATSAGLTFSPALALPVGQPTLRPNHKRSSLLAVGIPHPLLILAGLLVVMLAGFLLLSNAVRWWQTWQDDLTYGRPRTFQLDAWVGHNEQTGQPTHLVAQNVDRQVSIIEYPGGDPTKLRVLVGPHLFGKNDDLTPVKLRLADVNGDGHVDLVATIGNQQIVYINDNGQFRLLRDNERSQVHLPASDS